MTQPTHVQTGHPERRLGRLAPHSEFLHPRIHAGTVLADGYSLVVPHTVDWYSGISFPMALNDRLGCCTISDVDHAEQVFSHFGQGTTVTVSDSDVLTMYERVGHYIPGNPATDQGCVIQDVLDDWRKNGIAGHKILAFMQVDHTNLSELKACAWLFGGVTLGVNIPKSAMTQFNNGQPWDYDPANDNTIIGGHDVRLVGFDANGNMKVVTWSVVQTMTPVWLDQFGEEAWAQADGEWVKGNTSPAGVDYNALNAEFTKRTNQPGPFPAPVPPPRPPAPPTPPSDPDAVLVAKVGAWAAQRWHPFGANIADAINVWRKAKNI